MNQAENANMCLQADLSALPSVGPLDGRPAVSSAAESTCSCASCCAQTHRVSARLHSQGARASQSYMVQKQWRWQRRVSGSAAKHQCSHRRAGDSCSRHRAHRPSAVCLRHSVCWSCRRNAAGRRGHCVISVHLHFPVLQLPVHGIGSIDSIRTRQVRHNFGFH